MGIVLDHLAIEASDLELVQKRVEQRGVAHRFAADLFIAVESQVLQDFGDEVGIVLGFEASRMRISPAGEGAFWPALLAVFSFAITAFFQAANGSSTPTSLSMRFEIGLAPRDASRSSRSAPNLQKCW